MDNKKLYVTDWSKDSISEVDIDAGTVTVIANGIKKPTGIVRASLKLKKICKKTLFISSIFNFHVIVIRYQLLNDA